MESNILKRLREWFKKNAATLPWRPADLDAPRDPYAVWISETMLQQTQVATVRDYFVKWMKRFPDIETLAKASEEEVFRYWQGLGYYSRARNILKTAKIVCEMSAAHPEMPRTRKELEALPGIGAYTAGAILSLAYHQKEAILDGNLVRIFSRFYALDFLPTDKAPTDKTPAGRTGAINNSGAETYWKYAREVADSPKAYMHNEALMELGRTVCKNKNPDCANCPLKGGCRAKAEGRAEEFPPRRKREQKAWRGTALVVESADGKILAVSAGQPFLAGQAALPHFESSRNATAGIPAEAEPYFNADNVVSITECGAFRHNITVHKIECKVLHVKLATKANKTTAKPFAPTWIKKDEVFEKLANSFSIKALKLALN
ncbi:MAG: A/G-specific adenine glycosylase [Fibrobacter sp.]|nr:A/G-specific adenine glycosylase [Fibrobacter sp.]